MFSLLIYLFAFPHLLQLASSELKEIPAHALYIGVIDVQFVASDSDVQITLKLFSDDLEDAIINATGNRVSVQSESHCGLFKAALMDYFEDHLQIRINNQSQAFHWKSCKIVGDTHLLLFTVPHDTPWKIVQVQADFFMELFPTQANILKVNYAGEQYFGKLQRNKKSIQFSFTASE